MKRPILDQPFVTASGKILDGVEKVVQCPLWLCNVNVRKVCGKCLCKETISHKEKYVDCRYNRG